MLSMLSVVFFFFLLLANEGEGTRGFVGPLGCDTFKKVEVEVEVGAFPKQDNSNIVCFLKMDPPYG